MKILVTGSSKGIGLAVTKRLLEEGHIIIGFDLLPSSLSHPNYTHFVLDIKDRGSFPVIEGLEGIFNNAGCQVGEEDIDNNLKGTINITEAYAFQKDIKAVLFNASASASTGNEFPYYTASKSGLIGYMRNVAIRLAKYGATANSISLGGVMTESNAPVINELKLTIECKVVNTVSVGSHTQITGEVVNIQADESIIDERGKYDLAKLNPIIYDEEQFAYRTVGGKTADAFKAGLVYKNK